MTDRNAAGRRPSGRAAMPFLAALIAALATAVTVPGEVRGASPVVGPIVLPEGRVLTPAGTLTGAGDFPSNATLRSGSPGSIYYVTSGQTPNALVAVDPTSMAAIPVVPAAQTVPPSTNEAFYALSGGLTLSPDGSRLYVAGGRTGTVHVFTGTPDPVPLPDLALGDGTFVGGVAVSRDASALYATIPFNAKERNNKGSRVVRIPIGGGTVTSGSVGLAPVAIADGVAAAGREFVAVANRDSGSVTIVDPVSLAVRRTLTTGRQPAALRVTPSGADLLVVDALDDRLDDFDTATWSLRSSIALNAGAGLGSAPSAIDTSPDGATAVVALSRDNAIAVLTRLGPGWVVAGRIPTAWYPTSVLWDAAGARLLVTAGKGVGGHSGTTPFGVPVPNAPAANPGPSSEGEGGVLESIPWPAPADLAQDTLQVAHNNLPAPPSSPAAIAGTCAAGMDGIRHVVYIIRENKTYDEDLGDEPGGSTALQIYGRSTLPNLHALVERNALLENFYADEEVSDTGHQALFGGVANDWVERFAQQAYGLDGAQRPGAELGNDSSVLWSPGNYLLDNALAHNLTFRDYGEFYRRNQVTDAAVSTALESHVVHGFPHFGFAPDYPDTGRVAFWAAQFKSDVQNGTFPQLETIYLPEDHTTEGVDGTPMSVTEVADSDLATGQIVDAISHSAYWESTAIFMTEDDPQGGLDSVDDHRTVGMVVGPHVRDADATMTHFDQGSMLRTMEELLHLPPMTQLDATAVPMAELFTTHADTTPYSAIVPTPPAVPAATAAAVHSLSRRLLGPHPDLAAVPPDAQLQLNWLGARGTPYRPVSATPVEFVQSPRLASGGCAGAATLPGAHHGPGTLTDTAAGTAAGGAAGVLGTVSLGVAGWCARGRRVRRRRAVRV